MAVVESILGIAAPALALLVEAQRAMRERHESRGQESQPPESSRPDKALNITESAVVVGHRLALADHNPSPRLLNVPTTARTVTLAVQRN